MKTAVKAEKTTRAMASRWRPRKTMVTRDGLVARRKEEIYAAPDASRIVRALNALPTILEAWAESIPRSERKIVCWLPSTPRAMTAMQKAFWADEYAKARTQGDRFIWGLAPALGDARTCFNPESGKTYLVVRERDPKTGWRRYRCSCPRFTSAGVCKHIIDARLRKRFTSPH